VLERQGARAEAARHLAEARRLAPYLDAAGGRSSIR
jgi:hypothetical protein